MQSFDTIAAVATPSGRGGVGMIRVSGKKALMVAKHLLKISLKPRYAHYCEFLNRYSEILDQGIAIYFPGPHSFTGEDVLELQGHGGPVVLDLLLKEILHLGIRLARPGEFSERAFLNDKLDLTQAEAIADLIDATTEQAARNALHSLQGAFSKRIHELVEELIHLRIYVEAAIDFPEEEIDFLSDGKVAGDLNHIEQSLNKVFKEAQQGALTRDGIHVVIAGKPNAGKSSLLNALSGRDSAIVTDIAGTTRDVLREQIHIDGMPLHITDTAGLRESNDPVERIGIERAWQAIETADRIILLVDAQNDKTASIVNVQNVWPEFVSKISDPTKISLVRNKIDQTNEAPGFHQSDNNQNYLNISASTGLGMDDLRQHLKDIMGYQQSNESGFTARRRHLDALERAKKFIESGQQQLKGFTAGELLAEDLRAAQEALSEITGEFTSDDLLGRIFSSFCIGK